MSTKKFGVKNENSYVDIHHGDDPYKCLAEAIIGSAMTDYTDALIELRRGARGDYEFEMDTQRLECEMFFRSQYFTLLSDGCHGDWFIRMANEKAKRGERLASVVPRCKV